MLLLNMRYCASDSQIHTFPVLRSYLATQLLRGNVFPVMRRPPMGMIHGLLLQLRWGHRACGRHLPDARDAYEVQSAVPAWR